MKHLSKVVWSEGMYLGPQHFQAQNRYFEDAIHFAVTSLWFAPYGLLGWELDNEAVRNGTLALVHARGLFPDGLPFNMPESDTLPPARNIVDDISPIRDSATVMLAITRWNPAGVNVGKPGELIDGARFLSSTRSLHDENTGVDEKSISLGQKNIRLLLDTEISDNVVALPIARVKRDGAGHFMLDPDFVPPCLNIGGCDRLMSMLRRLIEILDEKSATLSQLDGAASQNLSQQELAKFWLLHSVNSSLASLRHLYLSKRGHPEELYLSMGSLAGALCTFKLESDPRNLPLYDHDSLTECFAALDQHIRAHLETTIPTTAISIALREQDRCFYSGAIVDQRALDRGRWVLAVGSDTGQAELISKVPALVKICSQQFIGRLVQKALPGLTLAHLSSPPPALATRDARQYFEVNRSGPCWDHINATREVGVYAPDELPNLRIELFAILES